MHNSCNLANNAGFWEESGTISKRNAWVFRIDADTVKNPDKIKDKTIKNKKKVTIQYARVMVQI